jgi:hypothetical protein
MFSLKNAVKSHAQRTGNAVKVYVLRNKATCIIAGLLAYSLLFPRSFDKKQPLKTPTIAARQSSAPDTPTTRRATTRPVADDDAGETGIGGVPLYNPRSNPAWNLPAEVSTDEIKDLVRRTNKLEQDLGRATRRMEAHHQVVIQLLSEQVRNPLWDRMSSGGYRDERLGLDWYELVKDDDDLLADIGGMLDVVAKQTLYFTTELRIKYMKARLIGGKPLIADQLFLRAMQDFADNRNAYYDRTEPAIRAIAVRLNQEFQKGSALQPAQSPSDGRPNEDRHATATPEEMRARNTPGKTLAPGERPEFEAEVKKFQELTLPDGAKLLDAAPLKTESGGYQTSWTIEAPHYYERAYLQWLVTRFPAGFRDGPEGFTRIAEGDTQTVKIVKVADGPPFKVRIIFTSIPR